MGEPQAHICPNRAAEFVRCTQKVERRFVDWLRMKAAYDVFAAAAKDIFRQNVTIYLIYICLSNCFQTDERVTHRMLPR